MYDKTILMKKTSETVLVTGGAGFIGSHVTDDLVNAGYKVVVLDDLSGGFKENVHKKAIFVKGTINDAKLIQSLFKKYRFTYVFHLAAYAAEGLSHFIKRFNYENNLIGSINLINASVNYGVKCFVFTSSIAVYGQNQLPMKESMKPNPEDSYGIAKYAVEMELEATHRLFGLEYIIYRPHNVYGERQHIGDKYRNVVGIFMNNLMQGKGLPVFGDGKQQRAFTHIADVAPIIASSIKNKKVYNQTFNLGSDKPYDIKFLAKAVAESMGEPYELIHLPARDEVKFAYSDHSKAKKMLKYKSSVSLKDGIKRMARWAKSVGPQTSKKFEGIEIDKNMLSAWK
jgi:UDP-glucose 4-epimerase